MRSIFWFGSAEPKNTSIRATVRFGGKALQGFLDGLKLLSCKITSRIEQNTSLREVIREHRNDSPQP